MTHTLVPRCDCRLCERDRFEARVTLVVLVALALVGVVLWEVVT